MRRFLFLGSSYIPKLTEQPIKEDSLNCGELEITNEWYATAKLGINFEALKKQYNFDSICLMPTNLYGQDYYHSTNSRSASLIKRFYEAKLLNKKVVCWGVVILGEFLHVEDLQKQCYFH